MQTIFPLNDVLNYLPDHIIMVNESDFFLSASIGIVLYLV